MMKDMNGQLTVYLRDAYSIEHLEIGGYVQMGRVADRAADPATRELAALIERQERHAAFNLAEAFEDAMHAALAERGLE